MSSFLRLKSALVWPVAVAAFFLTLVLAVGNDPAGSGANDLPRWRFNVIAGVSSTTANYYGGLAAVGQLITNQIEIVNHRCNDPQVFNGQFQFVVSAVYEFNDSPVAEIVASHPDYDFKVVYDGFSSQSDQWFGQYLGILHSWPVTIQGGIFGTNATDGLVHEFGHSRGAIDLYGLAVDRYDNEVNGQAYNPPNSIMTYPYGNLCWDEYSQHLINGNADVVDPPPSYLTAAFPISMGVKAVDANGVGFPNAKVRLYPVEWFQSSVLHEPILSGSTGPEGDFEFPANPFGPESYGNPWDIQCPNFLVSAQVGRFTAYGWLPLCDVQNAYFDNPTSPYRLQVRFGFGSFDSWRLAQFGPATDPEADGTGLLDDPQHNGISNLQAYAFDLDPHQLNTTNTLSCSIENGYFTATYTRRNTSSAYDLVFRNQYARELGGGWSDATLVRIVDNGETETVKFRDPLPVDQSKGAYFRVAIQYVP
jgi:hypothetical protein